MSLVVEDGSGKSDAQSYISVADAATYGALISTLWATASDAAKESALQLATQYLDLKYGLVFVGDKKLDTQALEWPRNNAIDAAGITVANYSVPQQIKIATIEIACAIIAGDTPLAASEDITTVQSESVQIGPLSFSQTGSGRSTVKRYPKVEKLVARFISNSTMERA